MPEGCSQEDAAAHNHDLLTLQQAVLTMFFLGALGSLAFFSFFSLAGAFSFFAGFSLAGAFSFAAALGMITCWQARGRQHSAQAGKELAKVNNNAWAGTTQQTSAAASKRYVTAGAGQHCCCSAA